ncbi:response regulator transcription factor [Brevibacillus sp. SYP-B805]|uniref:response regulator transcription factor n=1 Tax=Brevibacillus sp. SYP-B805 TaxID=1578199 RepID=UPI0013ED99C9|nr:winged helix-turn-helix domain-containing protein [Brevibacillus sp. SYP-B805]NGQ96894.1 response regulator transcription factor [Brevibacillus sp. SYP-B805]
MTKGLYVTEQSSGFTYRYQQLERHELQLLDHTETISREMIRYVILDCKQSPAAPLVKSYRLQYPGACLLVLAMRRDETDMLQAFAMGADDYQVKPCSEREVAARLRVMLKRREWAFADSGSMHPRGAAAPVDWDWLKGQLTKTESRLLHFLLLHSNALATRHQIIQAVWGDELSLSSKALDVHLFHLRRKLHDATNGRITIRSVTNRGVYLVDNGKP